jgi:hypothetical protein
VRITFVTGERTHVYVTRDDGSELDWSWPSGGGLPHDLAHYVVESGLGMRFGFWGLVADGVDFSSYGKPRGLEGRDVTELNQAEGAVAAATIRLTVPEVDAAAYLVECCEKASTPVPDIDAAMLDRLTEACRQADERWRALAPGESLTVEWPQPSTTSPNA